MARQYGCWAFGCHTLTHYVVSNPDTPLVRPVESCRNHLGDLLGNMVKAALDSGVSSVRPEIIPLGP